MLSANTTLYNLERSRWPLNVQLKIILCKLCYFASLKVDLAVTLKYLPGSRHTGQHCPVGSGLEQLVGGQCTFSHCTIVVCDSRMEGAAREEGKRNIKVVIAHSR